MTRKFDQMANEHVCTYLRHRARHLGATVSRQAGAEAGALYHNELAAAMVVFPTGSPVPVELRALLGMVAAGA